MAGVAGAVLTNPFDVIRNTMFRTDLPMMETIRHLYKSEGRQTQSSPSPLPPYTQHREHCSVINTVSVSGLRFGARGMGKNLVAVTIPISITIFLTDIYADWLL